MIKVIQVPHVDLTPLEHRIAQMAGLVEELLWQSFAALEKVDLAAAAAVMRSDQQIDRIEMLLRDQIVDTLADGSLGRSQQRSLIAAVKIIGELERVSGLARNTAQRTVHMAAGSERHRRLLSGLRHMTQVASHQMKSVLDALVLRDDGKALAAWRQDDRLDALYNSVSHALVQVMRDDVREIELCCHLLMCAKNLERIGDHATNIAEQTHFLVTGLLLDRHRAKHVSALGK